MDKKNQKKGCQPRKCKDITPTLINLNNQGTTNNPLQRLLRRVTPNLKNSDRIRKTACIPKRQIEQKSTEDPPPNPKHAVVDVEDESSKTATAESELHPSKTTTVVEAGSSANTRTNEEEANVGSLEKGATLNPKNVGLSDMHEHQQYREEIRLKFEVALENLIRDPNPNSPHNDEMADLLRLHPYELIPQHVLDFLFGGC